MIPKNIFTFWFSDNDEIPAHIQNCIDSQKRSAEKFGYNHNVVRLSFVHRHRNIPYIQQCLDNPHENKKWVKLTDFMRMWFLRDYGGWAIDADVEILEGKSFDSITDLFHNSATEAMVVGEEGTQTIPGTIVVGSAIVGATPEHPVIKKWMDIVQENFRGDDDLCYESSMDILNKLTVNNLDKVTVLPKDIFYPYNHFTGETKITNATVCIHHFGKTWVEKAEDGFHKVTDMDNEFMRSFSGASIWPSVSILVPVAREGGKNRLLKSFTELNYPSSRLTFNTHSGDTETVPEKIADLLGDPFPVTGEYICYMADDTEFTPDALRIAIEESLKYGKALVAFNTGELLPDEGNACEHFIIRRDFIPQLENGQIFSTDFIHVGCDNWLWAQAKKMGQAYRSTDAKVIHHHFSNGKAQFDHVYHKVWQPHIMEKDRETLKRKLATL